MNKFEKKNADFFNETCEIFKDNSWQACCYLDEFMQPVYYHSIFKNINKNFKNILDIGCGQGDLLNFINKNTEIDYTGIDVSDKMISKCVLKFPKNKFFNTSFLDFKIDKTFDVILAIGVFNLKISEEENEQINYLKNNVEKMYLNCKNSCSFTLLSKYGNPYVDKELFCYEPTQILEYCLGLTSSVIIDHSSIPIEFIVTLYKDQ